MYTTTAHTALTVSCSKKEHLLCGASRSYFTGFVYI